MGQTSAGKGEKETSIEKIGRLESIEKQVEEEVERDVAIWERKKCVDKGVNKRFVLIIYRP